MLLWEGLTELQGSLSKIIDLGGAAEMGEFLSYRRFKLTKMIPLNMLQSPEKLNVR